MRESRRTQSMSLTLNTTSSGGEPLTTTPDCVNSPVFEDGRFVLGRSSTSESVASPTGALGEIGGVTQQQKGKKFATLRRVAPPNSTQDTQATSAEGTSFDGTATDAETSTKPSQEPGHTYFSFADPDSFGGPSSGKGGNSST